MRREGSPALNIAKLPELLTSRAAREKLITDTNQVLGKYFDNRGLSFPIAAHLLAARV
jgi:hypothetical protein